MQEYVSGNINGLQTSTQKAHASQKGLGVPPSVCPPKDNPLKFNKNSLQGMWNHKRVKLMKLLISKQILSSKLQTVI